MGQISRCYERIAIAAYNTTGCTGQVLAQTAYREGPPKAQQKPYLLLRKYFQQSMPF